MAMASGNKQILLAKQQDKASNHSKTESYGHAERMDKKKKQGSDVEMPIGRKPRERWQGKRKMIGPHAEAR
jgi:hypothetical protein